jgi:hypothetical protein
METLQARISQAVSDLLDSFLDGGERCGLAGVEGLHDNSPGISAWIEEAMLAGLGLDDAVKLVGDCAYLTLAVDGEQFQRALKAKLTR